MNSDCSLTDGGQLLGEMIEVHRFEFLQRCSADTVVDKGVEVDWTHSYFLYVWVVKYERLLI